VSASETSITVRYHNGQTVTYTLSANVSITKVMNGHLTDLAVGEDVQIFLARGASSAISVTIFNT
jgi:hypothetical protein